MSATTRAALHVLDGLRDMWTATTPSPFESSSAWTEGLFQVGRYRTRRRHTRRRNQPPAGSHRCPRGSPAFVNDVQGHLPDIETIGDLGTGNTRRIGDDDDGHASTLTRVGPPGLSALGRRDCPGRFETGR